MISIAYLIQSLKWSQKTSHKDSKYMFLCLYLYLFFLSVENIWSAPQYFKEQFWNLIDVMLWMADSNCHAEYLVQI